MRINSYCEVDRSILFPHVEIGRHSRISRAIIDRGVRLPKGTEIGLDPEEDRKRFQVTDSGIVVVSAEDLVHDVEPKASVSSAAGGSVPA